MCKTYTYVTELRDLVVGADFKIYFKVKDKRYSIYFDAGAWWLKSDGLLCKLSYFVIDNNIASIVTYDKLQMKDWRFVNVENG